MTRLNASPFIHHIPHLRFGEFDLGGVLYHAHYFNLYEMTREAFLRSLGTSYPQIVSAGQHIVIAETHQRFLAPIRYGDEITVHLFAEELRRASVKLIYEILVNTKVVHSAWTATVFVQSKNSTFKPHALPDTLAAGFRSISQSGLS